MKIYLPNDADGNVIPSNVKVMYEKDGTVVRVDDMIYLIVSKKWRILSGPLAFEPDELYLTKPDSLKQLAFDLDCVATHPTGCVCSYLNRPERDCEECKFDNDGNCIKQFVVDVSARVHRLAGDAE